MSTVLVTGGSRFVGSHVILLLLNSGHLVRTTVRSLTREERSRDVERRWRRCRRATLVLRR
jgi:nucleoside-diphosphate-sugar epimerase